METIKPKVRKPVFFVSYDNKDITAHISPFVISVSYTDNLEGKADEISIDIEDTFHNWKQGWYPVKGDKLSLKMGYEDERLVNCGTFEIDEIEFNGAPDVVTIRAISASVTKALRQNNTKAYENKSLKQIAAEIAAKHELKLVGEIKDIKLKRITQNGERDLSFLRRIAEEYGYIFKIADDKLIFFEVETLRGYDVTATIDRKQMSRFRFLDKTSNTYKACEISYFDARAKKLITVTVKAKATETKQRAAKGSTVKVSTNEGQPKEDTLKLTIRCENKQQAIAKARAALNGKNKFIEADIDIFGEPRICAGINFDVTGLYRLNGKYQAESVVHTITRQSGYASSIKAVRI
ncbi:MAG: contractile injection system protein, VgrG/Pvc8 family [Campylobacterales bacterium]|nr:contractile injection system protein, VgrG/Pvc8 family [Campylobacterales bacterium]